MNFSFSLVMDGLVLLFLAATIFYAVKLSAHLKTFRSGRKDMERILIELSQNVARAEGAIEGLRQASREAGRDLQERINEAKGLSDELQLMSESGGNIASRLEKAATTRRPARRSSAPVTPHPGAVDFGREDMPKRSAEGFAIRDPEFGQAEPEDFGDIMEDEEERADNLSRAERELYDALRRSGKKRTDAGGIS